MLLGVEGEDKGAGTAVVSEFTEVDTLPCSEVEASVGYGNGEGDICKGRFGVGRHVVEPLHRMVIIWLTFRDYIIEYLVKVVANVRVCVLIDCQSA